MFHSLYGDLNELLCYLEVEIEGANRMRREIGKFYEAVDDFGLHDLGDVGNWYT